MRPRPAAIGWAGLTCYVILWDLYAPETLSSGFADAVRHPRRRWPVLLAWAITSLHLLTVLPPSIDPFSHLARRVRP